VPLGVDCRSTDRLSLELNRSPGRAPAWDRTPLPTGATLPTTNSDRQHEAMPTALVVIDVQEEYFSGRLPIQAPPREGSLALIGEAMDRATAAGIPVILVRHTGKPGSGTFEEGSPARDLRPEVAERHYDALIDKQLPGSFTGTPLQQVLADRHVDHITIAGYMTNVCCDTTARQALHMGMGATILHDAVGVPDMPSLDGTPIAAADLQRAALAPLALIGVTMSSTAEWTAGLAT
jgi:nicotinamidase-related amidase